MALKFCLRVCLWMKPTEDRVIKRSQEIQIYNLSSRNWHLQSYLGTCLFQNLSKPVLVAFWREKNISALSACLGLAALARTCMSLPHKRKHFIVWFSSILTLVTGSGRNWQILRYHCILKMISTHLNAVKYFPLKNVTRNILGPATNEPW